MQMLNFDRVDDHLIDDRFQPFSQWTQIRWGKDCFDLALWSGIVSCAALLGSGICVIKIVFLDAGSYFFGAFLFFLYPYVALLTWGQCCQPIPKLRRTVLSGYLNPKRYGSLGFRRGVLIETGSLLIFLAWNLVWQIWFVVDSNISSIASLSTCMAWIVTRF